MATTRGNARKNKLDEFYTQISDIENELKHYKSHFKDKVVFCNCDDPYESNFFKYFAMNFNYLGLKKLIATCYDSSPVAYTQLNLFGENKSVPNNNRHPYKIEINEVQDYNKDGATDLADVKYLLRNKKNTLTLLKENGDFRSSECVELLKQADIVVTNPPFSLFRDYITQLIEYNKKFLVIGNPNAVTYKEVFPLIKNNRLWIGIKSMGTDMLFNVSKEYAKILQKTKKEGSAYRIINGEILARASAIWYTNLEISKRFEELTLYRQYTEKEYSTYYKFDAININKVTDIPYDYDGAMGVPITFLDKYNPNQFEILGLGAGDLGREIGIGETYTDEELKKFKSMNPAFRRGIPFYFDNDGKLNVPYARIIIKRRKTNEDRT